ncbi:MAG: hypothetical protein CL761_03330 [Chloroflexi bacterium]|nr:hypothetical protein [Chloroflexota bacterium]
MAVTTKKTFAATSNATTTAFTPVSIQLNNQDDLDVYVTLSGGTRVLQLRQSTGSTAQSTHPQVNNTDGLYFPAVSAGTTLYNYQLSSDNNTITFNSALPQGAVVFCERRTRDADGTYTTFASGSTIRATDLNNSSTESNFTAQDARNKALEIEGALFNGGAITSNFVTSEKIVDGSILDADINASANIQGSKLANDSVTLDKLGSGTLPSDISVDANNIPTGTFDGRYYTETELDSGQLDNRYYTETELTSGGVLDSKYYTETELDAGQLDNRYYTETELNAGQLDTRYFTETELTSGGSLDGRYYTETELATDGVLDSRYFTQSAADARYFNISSGDTIKDGDAFPDNDTTIATTAAINDRIIDLIDDVGGFVPIANETSFPTANPDANNGTGTIVSVKTASTTLTPSGTTVTITNGAGTGNTVTITGVTSAIPQDFGFLVETTTTLHTYSFHRLVPKATEVTTVASNISAINTANTNASDISTTASDIANVNAVANDIANVNTVSSNLVNINAVANSLGTAQTYTVTVSGGVFYINGAANPPLTLTRGYTYTFDQSDSTNNNHPLAFRDSSNASYTTGVTVNGTAGQAGSSVIFAVPSTAPNSLIYYCTQHGNSMGNSISVIDDNIGIVAGSISNVNTTAGNITNVNNVGNSITNVNTVASNIGTVNDFAARYSSGATNPTTNLDTGDLFFNTTANELKIYNGSSWQGGVTAQNQLYSDNSVDTHLNQSNPTAGYVLSWNGSDYAWVDNAGYTDSDVNTHLNQSTANSNQVMSWNGTDYAWVDQSSGLVGGGNEQLFVEAENEVNNNFTTTTNKNYVSASPLTVASGVTVTIVAGSTMAFV